jgi:hypothetical protein
LKQAAGRLGEYSHEENCTSEAEENYVAFIKKAT